MYEHVCVYMCHVRMPWCLYQHSQLSRHITPLCWLVAVIVSAITLRYLFLTFMFKLPIVNFIYTKLYVSFSFVPVLLLLQCLFFTVFLSSIWILGRYVCRPYFTSDLLLLLYCCCYYRCTFFYSDLVVDHSISFHGLV